MKSILMSIQPKWVVKILNGEKTIEVRKRFTLDYRGWVYFYCTKGKDELWFLNQGATNQTCKLFRDVTANDNELYEKEWTCNNKLNRKIVARFYCDNVEEYRPFFHWCIEKETCLTRDEILDYLDSKDKSVGNPKRQDKVYVVHISQLEIFDKPKELWEFKTPKNAKRYKRDLDKAYDEDQKTLERIYDGSAFEDECANAVQLTEWSEGYYGLTKAPQSWQYIEVE